MNKLTMSKESRELYEAVVSYLRIEPTELETEIAGHSLKYAYLAACYSDVKTRKDTAKIALETTKAEQFINAKSASFEDGVGKITGLTENLAKAYAEMDSKVVQCKHDFAVAERELALWDNIMSAMEHRSYMLTKLADLRYAEQRLEAGVFNGQTREDIAKSMNNMANMDAKRQANLKSRQSKLDSLRKPAAKTEEDYGITEKDLGMADY